MKIGYLIPLLCLTACAQYPVEHYPERHREAYRTTVPTVRYESAERYESRPVPPPVYYPARPAPMPVYPAARPVQPSYARPVVVPQPSYPAARPAPPRRYERSNGHGHHH